MNKWYQPWLPYHLCKTFHSCSFPPLLESSLRGHNTIHCLVGVAIHSIPVLLLPPLNRRTGDSILLSAAFDQSNLISRWYNPETRSLTFIGPRPLQGSGDGSGPTKVNTGITSSVSTHPCSQHINVTHRRHRRAYPQLPEAAGLPTCWATPILMILSPVLHAVICI